MDKFKYWTDKIPEFQDNLEPLTLLMIRTTGEAMYYSNKHKNMKKRIINSKDINILHSIDRDTAIQKLKKRIHFLKKNKLEINQIIKKTKYLDLVSPLFENSPFGSINEETIAEINYQKNKNKYLTISGVGRIGAIQSVFPNGIPIKINVINIPYNLQKSLVAINNVYLYENRFDNLTQFKINTEEINYQRKPRTKKKYRRKKFLKSMKKKFINKLLPFKG